MRVVVGEEVRTPDGDVIGLFLTERIPYVLPLAEVIGRIRTQQAGWSTSRTCSTWPGPASAGCFRPCARTARWTSSRSSTPRSPTPALNQQAADLAAAGSTLPGGAGSDAHDAPGVGAAYLEMPDFDGPAGFLAALA